MKVNFKSTKVGTIILAVVNFLCSPFLYDTEQDGDETIYLFI